MLKTHAFRALVLAVLTSPLAAQALSGSYVIGPGGSYANIAAAGAALVANGVAGPVTFQVIANDVGPWTIPAITGQGASNPIVFDGGGATVISGVSPVLTLNGCSHVTFQGFVGSFTTGTFVSVIGTTSNCTFRACQVVAPVVTSGTTKVFDFAGGSDCVVEDCSFGGGWEAFFMQPAFNGLLMQRNRITTGGWWTGRLGGANAVFRNNFVAGTSNYGLSCGVSGSPLAATNLKIHNNSFYTNHPASGSQYNILRWYADAAVNSEVLNNAIHEIHFNTTNGFIMWCSGTYRPTVMDYNVYHLINGLAFMFAGANVTFAQWQALGFDASGQLGDPLYVNPNGAPADLSIQQGSPCIGTGTVIVTVTDDFFGNPRGPVFDVGAHQLGANNILSFVTSGGGVGDLFVSISDLDPNAVSGYMLISADTSHPFKSGPLFGMWPDFTTWTILTDPAPAFPGNPLHFVCNVPGVFPATPLTAPAGSLSFLGGSSWDVCALILGFGNAYVGVSNLIRVNW
ncbi:MAG TPA: hypothetical protein VEI02_05310 [Planctomycetota bacterium]|nr:hypothetical protein [Planctomycetota bacterium]